MTESESGLYEGRVVHRRVRPREHKLNYSVFSFLLDLDEIDDLDRKLKLFSRNRFNIFSFQDRDYCVGTGVSLRTQVEGHMRAAGLDPDGGPIRLLTMPRILGYAFNPINVYFCYQRSGALSAIFYEVNNTFGERHGYMIPVAGDARGPIRQQCPKQFYVSPFMDMGMTYKFLVVPPGERVVISVAGSDTDGLMITATLSAARTALTDGALARAFVVYPLLTFKVIAGIHWEALLIWLKGVRLRKRPPPPDHAVTIAHQPVARPRDA